MSRTSRFGAVRRLGRCAVALLVCAGVAAASAAELKIASVAPDGSHWMTQMRAGAGEIAARTDGRVTLKFYPGGVMGNDGQVLRKIRVGQLQGGAFTAGGLAERYGGLNLYGIPLLFRSQDEADHVRRQLDARLIERLEAAGFVALGMSEGGFAHLLSNVPIATVDDLRRKKVWIPEGDNISFVALESLGLSPVFLPVTDVLTGLQTGLIDVAFASPVAALVLQWHTKVKYTTDLPVSYSMGVFAIERAAFEAIAPADREIVREVMGRVMGDLDRTSRTDNERAAEVLRSSGVQSVAVDAAAVDGWRRTVEATYPAIRQRPDIDGPLFDELLALLAAYRGARP